MSELAVCPACGKQGIFVGSRSYYSRGWPAKCRECGGLAYDRPHGPAAAFGCFWSLFSELLVCAFIGACVLFPRTVVVGILILIPAAIFYRQYQRRHPKPATRFRSISPEESHRAYLRSFTTYLAVLVGIVAVIIWAAHSQ